MYGPIGQHGPMGPSGPDGEYGFFPFIAAAYMAAPLTTVVVGSLAVGGAMAGGGYLYSKHLAEEELARHTGGTIQGRPADEVHRDYCSTLPKTDPMWQKDELGQSFCGSTPSEDSIRAADIPEGFWEGAQETFGGYAYRISDECAANPNTPECVATGQGPDDKKPIPGWVILALAGIVAGVFFLPERKG